MEEQILNIFCEDTSMQTNKSKINRLGVISAAILMLLTACEQTSLTSTVTTHEVIESSMIENQTTAPNTNIESDPIVLDSKNEAPLVLPQKEEVTKDLYETGKPKEEPVLTNLLHSTKNSTLKPIYSVGKGEVAITIDDGPTSHTEELLKVLRANDTKVTFFFLGQNALSYPQSVTTAVYDGHEVGYHSNSHPKLTEMDINGQKKEFEIGLGNINKVDHNLITLFRPPYGAYNNDTKVLTEDHNMKMVLWNEDPRDWSTSDPSIVTQHVLSQVQQGSIIVLHDRPSTIAALPEIIKGIRKKGLKLVTITKDKK
ncbi:polysaccharide deacetylase family protein [Paenibacillus alginolyticus]|uniref:Polysaccharide deacetylase family protein n=1 Tax=Paenibacillus alginolyticus TaxID=59839 RepID=A0ABT4GB37_9BACL|nr:polysaccharide deacetylase family protein [Paenibacillus alginolyticus]MCY9693385.1 polysaccharide deacetylase family protein [Paenibacillus alginolyticus]MEC0144644.1 polysaccharide deacetylase family protein [Paenibacillus alginolyticus]